VPGGRRGSLGPDSSPSIARPSPALDAPRGGLRVGLPVEVTFERVDERLVLPRFRVCAEGYFPNR
jgi:hypothetical protein